MSSDQKRPRPRSSKKRRAVQPGAARSRPATQRAAAGPTSAGATGSGGLSTGMLALIAVVVFAIGVALAGGAIKFGGGAPGASNETGSSGAGAGHIDGCPSAPPSAAPAGSSKIVTIQTPKGAIEATLRADLSPLAVGNFLALVECGYYDDVVFHRVVPNFVIQAGDGQFGRTSAYDAARVGSGGPGYDIKDEPVTATYGRGTVAMARGSGPNSAGSQFFIVLSDDARASLAQANTYQVIGTVTKGMEVADAIATAADGEIPSQPVPMTTMTVADVPAPASGQPAPSPAASLPGASVPASIAPSSAIPSPSAS